jgi:hypothetical protein
MKSSQYAGGHIHWSIPHHIMLAASGVNEKVEKRGKVE